MSALAGIRILDLSRVLAGPFCTQMLGDLGAEIIKVERPALGGHAGGDDTRGWGPPFLKDAQGNDTSESAYYLSCNRNKRSIAIDIKSTEGQDLIRKLIAQSDVVIENFKVGGLEQYGLGYDDLKEKHPALIYCAISGFGQNGPMAREPGYDFLAQAMTGMMACTGAVQGEPMKAGVALTDIMTGMNAAIGVLAALRHRDQTGGREHGEGQLVDVALTDSSLASLTNIAQYYLTSGEVAPRQGNAHASIVPYQAFEAQDGHLIICAGNDGQFARFAAFSGHGEWAEDVRFASNAARVKHRDVLVPMIKDAIAAYPMAHWINGLRAVNVPCGPVNTMDKVFAMEQIQARDMQISMPHPLSAEEISLVGSPIKMSKTPVSYDAPPPICGQHTDDILKEVLDLDADAVAKLKRTKIVG